MVRVFGSIVEQHNLWLVGVAVIVSALCWAGALLVMDRVRGVDKSNRNGWLFLAALAAGGGAWATHFVGMLAYDPGVPTSFVFSTSILTAPIGIVGAFAALAIFARWSTSWGAVFAGLTMGVTMAAVHHVGMSGMEAAAERVWAKDLVIAATLFAPTFSVLGFWTLAQAKGVSGRALAGALFVTGMLLLHFTGVAALTLTPHQLVKPPAEALDHAGLATMIVVGAAALLIAAATFSFADRRMSAVRLANGARASRLAEAAFEGLAIHDGDVILDANSALAEMLGVSASDLIGQTMRTFIGPDAIPALQAAARGERPYPVQATMVNAQGLLEVEVYRRVLSDGLYVSCVRDISARRRTERADAARSRFFANMDHELRVPLKEIVACSRVLLDTSEHSRAEAERVLGSAQHLIGLLDAVVDAGEKPNVTVGQHIRAA